MAQSQSNIKASLSNPNKTKLCTKTGITTDTKTLSDTYMSPQKTTVEIAADSKWLEDFMISNLMKNLSKAENTGLFQYVSCMQWHEEGIYADITEKYFRLAIEEINKRPKIVAVQFISANINDKRVEYLAKNLNETVTSINLHSNPISDTGLKDLVKRRMIRELSINYWPGPARITDEGIKAVSESTTLIELSISGEYLTPTAGTYLAANKSLLKLRLFHSITGTNPKTEAERIASNDLFATNLSLNTTLREFHAPYVDFSPNGILVLARMGNLEKLDIRSFYPTPPKTKGDIVELRKSLGLLTAFSTFCQSETPAECNNKKTKTMNISS